MIDYLKNIMKLLNIYKMLLVNIHHLGSEDIEKLYIEYLKVKIKLGTNHPNHEKDLHDYDNCNCYCYALGLRYPKLFCQLYEYAEIDGFGHNLGFISGKMSTLDRNKLLENLYSDLEALGIQYYDSTVSSPIRHDGYKIAIYIAERYDFHLMRQNADGLWSEKVGYNDLIRITDIPKASDLYEHVKTLEIVKPIVKKL